MKTVTLESLKRFITMMVNYLISKLLRLDRQAMIDQLRKILQEFLTDRGI